MMKATDFSNRDDLAEFRPLNWSAVGCVLVERQVSAGPMIVGEVRGQDASQMPLGENDDMVQALASHRANEPLREGILPGTARGRDDFTDPHAFDALTKRVPVDTVAIAEKITRRRIVRERVDELLGGPGGGGMLGDVEVDEAPAVVGEHDEDEEDAEPSSGHGEEIDRDQVPDMIGQKGSPSLRWRGASLRNQPRDGALGHIDAELEEFAMDAWGAPEWVRGGHAGDQGLDLGIDERATSGRAARELGPVLAEAAPLPSQDSVGSHDYQEAVSTRPRSWSGRPRKDDQFWVVEAGSRFACRRRAAGARRGSQERAGGGRRKRRG